MSTKKWSITVFFSLVLVGSLSLVVPRWRAHAASGCSVSSLNGPFSFSTTGFFTNNGQLGLASNVGRILLDGTGNLSGSETASVNGTILRNFGFSGTYTVAQDCTGSATLQPSTGGAPSPIDFVITANGTLLQLMYTIDGFSVSGTAYQMGNPPQSN